VPDLSYDEFSPAPSASAAVRAVWTLRGVWEPGAVQPIVSDGCAELIFNVGDDVGQRTESGAFVIQPRAMLVGPTAKPIFVRPGRAIAIVGVRLQPWATSAVTRADATELRDRVMALDDVSPVMRRVGASTLEHLAGDIRDIDALGHGIAKLARWERGVRALAPVVSAIRDADVMPSVRQLAARFGRSVRSVQRGFRHDIGVEPRTLLRLARVQRALRLAAMCPDQPWVRLAASAGYYDQPHFVREFRDLVGMLPSEYRPDPASLTTSFVEKA
jgi:AraC-like DNA-binding protein